MKKILVCVMVLALCLCATISSFAAGKSEADYTGQTGNQDVNVTISGDVVHTYLVDIEFTNPTFTYSTGSVWNPEKYQYEPSTEATWNGTGEVKIVNHSDLPVTYKVEATDVVNTYGALTIPVTNGNGTIAKCSVGDAATTQPQPTWLRELPRFRKSPRRSSVRFSLPSQSKNPARREL